MSRTWDKDIIRIIGIIEDYQRKCLRKNNRVYRQHVDSTSSIMR